MGCSVFLLAFVDWNVPPPPQQDTHQVGLRASEDKESPPTLRALLLQSEAASFGKQLSGLGPSASPAAALRNRAREAAAGPYEQFIAAAGPLPVFLFAASGDNSKLF